MNLFSTFHIYYGYDAAVDLKNIYRRMRSHFFSTDLANLFRSPSGLSTNNIDCRNVFQTWRTSKFDLEHAKVIEKCIKKNPQWRFYLFLDHEMDAFMEDNFFGDPILKIFQGSKYMATKADIWRLCILHKFGGLYLDIDSTIKFNLEETLAGRSEYLSFAGDTLHSEIDPLEFPEDIFFSNRKKIIDNSLLHPDHMVLNWCMFFKKEHPILQIALDDIRNNALHYWDREFNNTRRAVIHLAGPMSLTRAIWRYVESGYKPDQETFDFADSAIFKAIGRHSVYFAQDHYTIGTHKRILQTDLLEHSK